MKFTLPIPPLSTNHGYHTNRGRWYKDKKLIDWETECILLLRSKKIDKMKFYRVDIYFYFGNMRRNDIDGRIKPILDVLTKAGIYEDDSLVWQLNVTKGFDKKNPRVDVEVI